MEKYIETKDEALHRVRMANKADYNRLFTFSEAWVKTQFKWFSADDLKEAYYLANNPIPAQVNIFGAVFSNLAKAKLIFHQGFTKSKHKVAHGRDLKTWISKEFKQRQANNASNKSNLKLDL